MPAVTTADFHPLILEGLCCQEALRRFGFDSADLFVAVSRCDETEPELGLFTLLRTQGKEFKIPHGPSPISSWEKFRVEWERAVEFWNHGFSEQDRMGAWDRSSVKEHFLGLANALLHKGFVLPNLKAGARG